MIIILMVLILPHFNDNVNDDDDDYDHHHHHHNPPHHHNCPPEGEEECQEVYCCAPQSRTSCHSREELCTSTATDMIYHPSFLMKSCCVMKVDMNDMKM